MALKQRLGSLMRKHSSASVTTDPNADTPEANAVRGVKLFCESGDANSGEEVLHLPTIVDAAVATPTAAAAAAAQIRKFLSKDNLARPHVQYNAIMLIRILADNPGPSFTKSLDKSFADTVKHLLRYCKDPSVSQIMRETLDALERDKAYDTNLNTLFAMWRKEKGYMDTAVKQFNSRRLNAPAWTGQQAPSSFGAKGGLPSPVELAGRIEEARTSAKLLLQLVQSTPPNELLGNELVKEFAERCTKAQRSVQRYIACDSPAPDDDTMLTLIETNEQLSLAASKHQRAVLQARRLVGPSPSPPAPVMNTLPSSAPPSSMAQPASPHNDSSTVSPLLPSLSAHATDPYAPPPSNPALYHSGDGSLPASLQAAPHRAREATNPPQEEDPFADPYTSTYTPPTSVPSSRPNGYGNSLETYHPGFQSTPSYLNRQESSANNLTMHGAQPQIPEEKEPVQQRPQTPDYMPPQQHPDVSPIAERNTVTYRY